MAFEILTTAQLQEILASNYAHGRTNDIESEEYKQDTKWMIMLIGICLNRGKKRLQSVDNNFREYLKKQGLNNTSIIDVTEYKDKVQQTMRNNVENMMEIVSMNWVDTTRKSKSKAQCINTSPRLPKTEKPTFNIHLQIP